LEELPIVMENADMQRMAVIDLDDTLLSPEKEISSANLEALKLLRENGFEIIIASGRHHENIMSFQDRIGQQGCDFLEWCGRKTALTFDMLHELTLTLTGPRYADRCQEDRLDRYHRDGALLSGL
jgi:hypothetical protein